MSATTSPSEQSTHHEPDDVPPPEPGASRLIGPTASRVPPEEPGEPGEVAAKTGADAGKLVGAAHKADKT